MKSNQRRGLIAKRHGEAFELLVERSCIRYRDKGLADIKKTPEPLKPIGVLNRQKQLFKAVYAKKAQPDFTGTLKGGRSVMIEAKHSSVKRIEFDRINLVQEKDLDSCSNLGGLALALISFEMKKFYCIRWEDWKILKNTVNKKSLNDKDLAPYEVYLERGLINFLKGI